MNSKSRKTLEAIFSTPTKTNIEFSAIEKLFVALGGATETFRREMQSLVSIFNVTVSTAAWRRRRLCELAFARCHSSGRPDNHRLPEHPSVTVYDLCDRSKGNRVRSEQPVGVGCQEKQRATMRDD